ncbi:hypothetical protein L596_028711 [Steinernema carpocapsae]|uniref:Uncharacterized protein n=1 Tax=Steinernema carpocapsae TaxID=34508 RepID=A0A4U5LZ54_STECR|nr:hypothetical protein L596_028711 [Steinernema carpocapsae]
MVKSCQKQPPKKPIVQFFADNSVTKDSVDFNPAGFVAQSNQKCANGWLYKVEAQMGKDPQMYGDSLAQYGMQVKCTTINVPGDTCICDSKDKCYQNTDLDVYVTLANTCDPDPTGAAGKCANAFMKAIVMADEGTHGFKPVDGGVTTTAAAAYDNAGKLKPFSDPYYLEVASIKCGRCPIGKPMACAEA